MRFSTAAIAATLVATAHADVAGIAVPETIKAGSEVTVQVVCGGMNMGHVQDVAMVIGMTMLPNDYRGSFSTLLDTFYLGPNIHCLGNDPPINKTIKFPNRSGGVNIIATMLSISGATHGRNLVNYEVNVTMGDTTSKTYKTSEYFQLKTS